MHILDQVAHLPHMETADEVNRLTSGSSGSGMTGKRHEQPAAYSTARFIPSVPIQAMNPPTNGSTAQSGCPSSHPATTS
jgi:hypothetical protein